MPSYEAARKADDAGTGYAAALAGDTRPGEWDCEAYGPEGRGAGALCFFAEPGTRRCESPRRCQQVMTAERQRVFGRIQELAAAGDPAGVELARAFTSTRQLLGGDQ